MQFAHACDHRSGRSRSQSGPGRSGLPPPGGGRASAILSWSAAVLGSIAIEITGSGKVIDSRMIGLAFVAQRVAGEGFLQTEDGADIASLDLIDLFAAVGVHADQAANALRFFLEELSTAELELITPEYTRK